MQNLRAYFKLYLIAIKWIMCVQKKIEFSSMSQRSSLSSTKFQEISIWLKSKITINFQGWQKADILLHRGGICHPTPSHGYGAVSNRALYQFMRIIYYFVSYFRLFGMVGESFDVENRCFSSCLTDSRVQYT